MIQPSMPEWHYPNAGAIQALAVGWLLPSPVKFLARALVRYTSPTTLILAFRTLRSLKGATPMNVLTLIPAALTIGEDLVKLSTDLSTGDKDAAVAAVVEALPSIAALTGMPLVELQAILTPANIGAAFEAEQAAQKIVVAVEAYMATHTALVVPQAGEGAPVDGESVPA